MFSSIVVMCIETILGEWIEFTTFYQMKDKVYQKSVDNSKYTRLNCWPNFWVKNTELQRR